MLSTVVFNGRAIDVSKVVCIGRNYVEHIEELNNPLPAQPVVFIKPSSAIAQNVVFNPAESIDYEAEFCFLVIDGGLAGVGVGLDLTKRDLQRQLKNQSLPWERAKAFDGSAVFSEFALMAGNMMTLRMTLHINSRLAQTASYTLMINKPDQLLRDVQSFMTLNDGDIVMTGTPKGVGVIEQNDIVTGAIYQGNQCLIEKTWVVI